MSTPSIDNRARVAQAEHPADDPMLSNTPVTFRSTHQSIGLTLSAETNDVRIHDAMLDSFGPTVDVGDRPDLTMRIFVQHVDEEPGWEPRQPLVRAHSGMFIVGASRATVVAGNFDTRMVTGFISPTAASHPDFLRAAIIQSAFLQFAQASTLVPIHTACLWRNGVTILVRGASGAGKSTLCYAALKRGWSLVAEDVVFVRTSREIGDGLITPADLEMHGMPWTLHLLPDARMLFPELASEPAFERLNGEMKIGVTIEDRFPGQARRWAPIGSLVVVARGQSREPRLSRMPDDEVLEVLRATAIMNEADVADRHGLWDAFLSQPAYLLETGDDPDSNGAMLDQIRSDG